MSVSRLAHHIRCQQEADSLQEEQETISKDESRNCWQETIATKEFLMAFISIADTYGWTMKQRISVLYRGASEKDRKILYPIF